MAKPIGHEEILEALSSPSRPQVTLIEGPDGIGKKLVAREAAASFTTPTNLIEVGRSICTRSIAGDSHAAHQPSCEVTTASVADHLAERVRIRLRGDRAILFDAGRATTGAANGLLKLLEEPPPKVYFIMWASTPVLPTIASRAERLIAQPLKDEQVVQVLKRNGAPEARATTVSKMSAGRPGRALELDEVVRQRGAVLQLVKAGMEDDSILLTNACRSLAPATKEDYDEVRAYGDTLRGIRTIDLLRTALVEARTRSYMAFSPEELFGLEDLDPRDLDTCIRRTYPRAQASLVARSTAATIQRLNRRRTTRR